jgi:hypothetical protein
MCVNGRELEQAIFAAGIDGGMLTSFAICELDDHKKLCSGCDAPGYRLVKNEAQILCLEEYGSGVIATIAITRNKSAKLEVVITPLNKGRTMSMHKLEVLCFVVAAMTRDATTGA